MLNRFQVVFARLTFLLAATLLPSAAHASLTVLVGEPFGSWGTLFPVGHTAVYLDRVCADGPLKLRMCQPGELPGVAIARYHRIGGNDWIASPILQFLYATDRLEEVPTFVTPEVVWGLQQSYRRRYMAALVPDGSEEDRATEEWWQTAGVAYNRRYWGYRVETTLEQDERLIAMMNALPNHRLYHLRRTNCANFVADIVNFYFPGTVKRGDHIADFGLMTPKHVARSLAEYGEGHPASNLRVLEIPQWPGSKRRSRPVRGAAEAGLKTKRYLFTLLAIQPEIPLGLAVLYLDHGRWQIGKKAEVVTPSSFKQELSATSADNTAGTQ